MQRGKRFKKVLHQSTQSQDHNWGENVKFWLKKTWNIWRQKLLFYENFYKKEWVHYKNKVVIRWVSAVRDGRITLATEMSEDITTTTDACKSLCFDHCALGLSCLEETSQCFNTRPVMSAVVKPKWANLSGKGANILLLFLNLKIFRDLFLIPLHKKYL